MEGYNAQTPVFYDTDAGRKMSLATSVQTSPRRYSVLHSSAPRFAPLQSVEVPFGVYSTDTAHKKGVESFARDNRRFYSSAFQSKDPRFGRPWTAPTADTELKYTPERTSNFSPATLSRSMETSSIKYSIHRSRYRRFPDKPNMTAAPDVIYSVDCYPRETMYTAMVHSPISYSNMGASSSAKAISVKREEHASHLGPGSYDYVRSKDVRVSGTLDQRPLSSMQSRTVRFSGQPNNFAGSTMRPNNDAVNWGRGTTISKQAYLRPQYLPKAYKEGGKEK